MPRYLFFSLLSMALLSGCGESSVPHPVTDTLAVEGATSSDGREEGEQPGTGVSAGDTLPSVVPADSLQPDVGEDAEDLQAPEDPGEGQGPEASVEEGARFPKPTNIRGIYLNAWTAGSATRRGRLVEMARRTELNAFVIDIKDATGYVSFPTRVPLAREVGATNEVRIQDLPALLA
jgi:hypothetical protein